METQLNMAHYAPRALLESEIKSQDDMSRASNNYAMSVESGEPELEIDSLLEMSKHPMAGQPDHLPPPC